jgi:hypothetical protein
VDDGPVDAPFFEVEGRTVILSSTGEPEGMHGAVALEGVKRDGPPMVAYNGEIHFDPD